jgi:hypothetical protein
MVEWSAFRDQKATTNLVMRRRRWRRAVEHHRGGEVSWSYAILDNWNALLARSSATVAAEPAIVVMGHRTQCQRRSGVPLTVNTYFKKDDVKLAGDLFERPAPEGRKVYNYFCPTCGTTLGWRGDVRPDVIGVAAGCFADKSLPTPSVSIWEETMHPWIKLPEGMQHFPQAR